MKNILMNSKRIIRIGLIAGWLAGLLAAGCAGGNGATPERQVAISDLAGSLQPFTDYTLAGDTLTLDLGAVDAAGRFLSIALPVGTTIARQEWAGADGVLGMVVPVGDGAELGVVPTAAYTGQPVSVVLELVPVGRGVSVPPVGAENLLTDFAVASAGAGQVELTWTQINAGDYSLDGLVGVQDLTPIGQLYETSYDRGAPGASSTREYWVDGSGDGLITVADITAIGQNYGAFIDGYNIYHNGAVLSGTGAGAPSVSHDAATPRAGLPPVYSVIVDGAVTDEWWAISVDAAGTEGAGSGAIIGDIDLRANINITGLDLFDLNGTNPGPFQPSKSGSRVIDPIEIINSARLTINPLAVPVNPLASTAEFSLVPRGKVLYLDILYLPTLNLATGTPRTTTSVKSGSTVTPGTEVVAVPFRLPTGGGVVEIDADVNLAPAPGGGYFVNLVSAVHMPGDDPLTPAVENGYTVSNTVRLNYAASVVSSDSDADGDYEDEAELGDDDRDCISSSRSEQEFDDHEDGFDDREELEVEGTVVAYDELNGLITLGNPVLESGGGDIDLTDPVVLQFSEGTRFEEKIKLPGEDIEQDIDPSSLAAGDMLKIELYALEDFEGVLPTRYWVEKVTRVVDQT